MNTTNSKNTVVIGLVRVPGICDLAGYAPTLQTR